MCVLCLWLYSNKAETSTLLSKFIYSSFEKYSDYKIGDFSDFRKNERHDDEQHNDVDGSSQNVDVVSHGYWWHRSLQILAHH